MSLLEGKTAVVTGAARGLGRDYAGYFAADGANVVLGDVNVDGVEEAAREIAKDGGNALGVAFDVTSPESAEAAVKAAVAEFGGVDILINNAGIWGDYRLEGVLAADLDFWDFVLRVNLTGPLVASRAAVPVMKERSWGRIVNISSIGAWMPGSGVYGVSKLALNQLTFQLAHETGDFGITCNAVAPGGIQNEATLKQAPKEVLDMMVVQQSIKRPGTSRDMYGAIRWLCSDDADWVTGQVITPNGGLVSRF